MKFNKFAGMTLKDHFYWMWMKLSVRWNRIFYPLPDKMIDLIEVVEIANKNGMTIIEALNTVMMDKSFPASYDAKTKNWHRNTGKLGITHVLNPNSRPKVEN